MKRKIILLLFLFTCVFNAFATMQVSDLIKYNGNEYPLIVTFPMEDYFIEFPAKRPSAPTSAIWRGYIATFEIIDNELWIIEIKNLNIWNGNSNIINDCFGVDRKKVDWYNGYLIIPQGERIDYEKVSWDVDYEYYLIIEIQNGNIINENIYNSFEYSKFFEEKLSERYGKLFDVWNEINFPRKK